MSDDEVSKEDQLAKACAEKMFSTDLASQGLGMKIEEVRAGYARLTMTVREDMTNGHKITHGGFMFLLADSAFAFACNSRNQFAVAQMEQTDAISSASTGSSHFRRSECRWEIENS